jgi:soluble lytic murein transglycosylase-like protein/TolA-binding protein
LFSLSLATATPSGVLVATHQCTELKKTAPTPLSKGICALELGDANQALTHLQSREADHISPVVQLLIARAQHLNNDHKGVLTATNNLVLPAPFDQEVTLLRGRALVQSNDSLTARPLLRGLLSGSHGSEARYWLAVGGEQRGDITAAVNTYIATWEGDPGVWGDRAAERLQALDRSLPDLSTKDGLLSAKRRADTLTAANEHTRAAAILKKLGVEDTSTTPTRHGLALARAQAASKAYPAAITTYSNVLGSHDNATGSAADLFNYALTVARTGDYTRSTMIYSAVIAQHPVHKKARHAQYKIGYMAYDEARYDDAIDALTLYLRKHPQGKHVAEARWFSGRAAMLLDRYDAALEIWRPLASRKDEQTLTTAAQYWSARILGKQGDKDAEQKALQSLLLVHPETGYGYFAAVTLGHSFSVPGPIHLPSLPIVLAENPDIRVAKKLLDVGLNRFAAAYLNRALPLVNKGDRNAAVAFAHLLISGGEYQSAMKLAKPFCSGADLAAQSACLPRPAQETVQGLTYLSGLPANLPYAIMKAESALKPWVSSHAGARGLMQLMPAVGANAHALFHETGDPAYHPDQLFDPDICAALGTTELNRLLERFEGKYTDTLPLIIASYNAGPEAIERWLLNAGENNNADTFAENISYTETRRYVRRVLGYLMSYRMLYGDAN